MITLLTVGAIGGASFVTWKLRQDEAARWLLAQLDDEVSGWRNGVALALLSRCVPRVFDADSVNQLLAFEKRQVSHLSKHSVADILLYLTAHTDMLASDSAIDKTSLLACLTSIATSPLLVRQASGIAANLVAHNPTANLSIVVESLGLKCLASVIPHAPDDFIRANSIRLKASLAALELKGPIYAEGIYLLHPTPGPGIQPAVAAALAKDDIEFDIVFIHGMSGHPFTTWVTSLTRPGEPDEQFDQVDESTFVCWPKSWIPLDFPKCRVISIGYDVFMSKWGGGSATPLLQQSEAIMYNLRLAEVGVRPIIFVCHSFGGLVIKQILKQTHSLPDAEFGAISRQTLGIVFYATPHFGSKLATYAHTVDAVLRTTSAITDLLPTSAHVDSLTRLFPTFAPSVSTLSLGESEPTCFSKYLCYKVVDEASANPHFEGTAGAHKFVLLNGCNHRSICKPFDRSDEKRAHLCTSLSDLFLSRPAPIDTRGNFDFSSRDDGGF
eukprot:gene5296-6139_t